MLISLAKAEKIFLTPNNLTIHLLMLIAGIA